MTKSTIPLFRVAFSLLIGLSLALFVTLAEPSVVRANLGVLYTAPSGLTSGLCESWANACSLQYALSIAVSGDDAWVKQGVYYPDSIHTDIFTLVDDVVTMDQRAQIPAQPGAWAFLIGQSA